MPKGYPKPPKRALTSAFHEVYANPPKAVKKTARKKGAAAAQRQAVAVALSKARRAGRKQ